MKQWLCWFFLVVGVVFFLWIQHRRVSPYLCPRCPQSAGDQSVLKHNDISSWCPALQVASPVFTRNRAGALEFFAAHFGFLITRITDDAGPPWLDGRGPPGSHLCSQLLMSSRKAAGLAGRRKECPPPKFPPSDRRKSKKGFCTSL